MPTLKWPRLVHCGACACLKCARLLLHLDLGAPSIGKNRHPLTCRALGMEPADHSGRGQAGFREPLPYLCIQDCVHDDLDHLPGPLWAGPSGAFHATASWKRCGKPRLPANLSRSLPGWYGSAAKNCDHLAVPGVLENRDACPDAAAPAGRALRRGCRAVESGEPRPKSSPGVEALFHGDLGPIFRHRPRRTDPPQSRAADEKETGRKGDQNASL